MMAISVTEPIGRAFDWMKVVLFQPFDLGKWFTLGFCSFLAYLGEGGGRFSFNSRMGGGGGPNFGQMLRDMTEWVEAHVAVIVVLVMAGLTVVVVLGALFAWLSSRGKFMLLDGVVCNRGAVTEPWRRFRVAGNRLFVFRLVVMLVGMAVGLLVALVCLSVAWPEMRAGELGWGVLTAVLIAVGTMLPFGLGMWILKALLADFVVPIMYRRDVTAAEGLGVLWREMLRGHVGSFILFYLLKFVLGLAAGVVVFLGMCLTCCVTALPYLSSVVFLPVSVFFRSYSLYFLEQFGPEWHLLGGPAPLMAEVVGE